MRLTSFYPVLCAPRLTEAHAFYVQWFGFETVWESDWYISLKGHGYELALLDPTHPTIPEGFRHPARGMLLNLEVEDVDAEWRRLVLDGGMRPELEIRSEDFGQRHFIVADPNGILIDVITPIEFTGDYQ
jgi:catechol 2,3-dioxygenase-like lactoylglutathione lyase family enzyme